jgi:hypothetical protein
VVGAKRVPKHLNVRVIVHDVTLPTARRVLLSSYRLSSIWRR